MGSIQPIEDSNSRNFLSNQLDLVLAPYGVYREDVSTGVVGVDLIGVDPGTDGVGIGTKLGSVSTSFPEQGQDADPSLYSASLFAFASKRFPEHTVR